MLNRSRVPSGRNAPLPVPTEARRSGQVSARVYRTVREQILDGKLAAGTRLSQQALAQALGTSNGPVISALRRLIHDGLVSHEPSHGYRVCEWTAEKMEDLLAVRRALETEAARLAARRAAPIDLDYLRAIVAGMADAVRQGRRADADALDAELHLAIARLSRTPSLLEAINRCHVIGIARRRLRQNERFGDVKNLAANHALLVDAIASRDPDQAARAMHEHLSQRHAGPLLG